MKSKASFIHERRAGHTLLRDLVLVWVLGFHCFSTTGFSQQLNQSPPAPAAPDTSTQTDSTNLAATTPQIPVPASGPTPILTVANPDLPKPITEQLLIGSRLVFRSYKEGEGVLPDGEIDRTKFSFYPLYIQEIQLVLGGECILREKGAVEMSGSAWDPECNRVTWKFSQGILSLAGSRAYHHRASGGGAVQQVEFVVEFVLRKSNLENFYEALTSINAKHNPQIVRDEAAGLNINRARLAEYDKRSYDLYCPAYNISDINGNIIWKNLQVRQGKTEEVEGYGPGGWDYLVAASYTGKPLISGSLMLGRVNEVSSVDPIPAVSTPSPTTTPTPVATSSRLSTKEVREELQKEAERLIRENKITNDQKTEKVIDLATSLAEISGRDPHDVIQDLRRNGWTSSEKEMYNHPSLVHAHYFLKGEGLAKEGVLGLAAGEAGMSLYNDLLKRGGSWIADPFGEIDNRPASDFDQDNRRWYRRGVQAGWNSDKAKP